VTTLAVNRFILKLNREMGLTSIVVTHDLSSALNYASRIMLLKDGKVVECAPPKEFLASKKPEVLEFLSAMKGDLQ
jgi:phospholipid/cholesterol/gamma-HCH transport system ATP-binding protein